MPRLFSYGTLQDPKVQHETFGRLLVGEPDGLSGWHETQIEITDPEVLRRSGKRFHPVLVKSQVTAETPVIAGTVFVITEAELAQADAYEVDAYIRSELILDSGRSAWVYVGNPAHLA